uniref:Uncharacterized protein n=1 Tax=Anguilla anguilla TaxID=7936 RepID=A0A0E9VP47_ANGAN
MAHSIKAPHCGSWISLKALDLILTVPV